MNYLFYLIIIFNILTACTIGITRDSDDNAILWKNRDRWLRMDEIDTKIKSDIEYYPSAEGTLPYICVETRDSDQTFMGMNEAGKTEKMCQSLINSGILDVINTAPEESRKHLRSLR